MVGILVSQSRTLCDTRIPARAFTFKEGGHDAEQTIQ